MRSIFLFFLLVLLTNSCTETSTKPPPISSEVIFEPDSSDTNRIFIRDRTGKEWDVTHAVNKYGFDPDRFQYGLGPFAIKPLLEPEFLSPEDPDFGTINGDVLVIGAVLNGSARAYPLYILGGHEIVDERFGATFVAVGY